MSRTRRSYDRRAAYTKKYGEHAATILRLLAIIAARAPRSRS